MSDNHNNDQQQSPALNFFFSEQKGILIVTFVGSLKKPSLASLQDCLNQIVEKSFQWAILQFREVPPEIDHVAFPALARFQKIIRERPAVLRLTSLHPELKKQLTERGLVRGDELYNNLAEALKSLMYNNKSKAA